MVIREIKSDELYYFIGEKDQISKKLVVLNPIQIRAKKMEINRKYYEIYFKSNRMIEIEINFPSIFGQNGLEILNITDSYTEFITSSVGPILINFNNVNQLSEFMNKKINNRFAQIKNYITTMVEEKIIPFESPESYERGQSICLLLFKHNDDTYKTKSNARLFDYEIIKGCISIIDTNGCLRMFKDHLAINLLEENPKINFKQQLNYIICDFQKFVINRQNYEQKLEMIEKDLNFLKAQFRQLFISLQSELLKFVLERF